MLLSLNGVGFMLPAHAVAVLGIASEDLSTVVDVAHSLLLALGRDRPVFPWKRSLLTKRAS
jgi:hypothetical protein